MKAEVISIGDELTSGQRLDTNSQYLSQRLGDLGIAVAFHTTVGDTLQDNIDVFRIASQRADIVVASGGLGPTADDLTREAMSAAFGLPLELRSEALQHIESLFSKRKRAMPERNRVQAMFPETSEIIENPHGTAPGIDLSVANTTSSGDTHRCRLFALPGVPAEMKEMMERTVEPRLIQQSGAGTKRWRYHSIKLFGIGESDVEKELPDLIARNREPKVGITVSNATITLRIAARTETEREFQQLIEPTRQEILKTFGLLVFGEGEVDLQHAVDVLLVSRKVRVGVVEIGAGTWVAPMLSCAQPNHPFGLVDARWMRRWSESDDGELDDVVGIQQHLMELAEAYREESGLDYYLAVGVYPDLENVQQGSSLPTTDFSIALARRGSNPKGTTVGLGGHPEVFYARLAKTALNFLRLELLRGPMD